MDGILNIVKPSGPTSHDVVARLRRVLRMKRIGHAGTLDPAASGVLLICLGKATRIVEYLMDQKKTYRAGVVFGVETDTEDASGKVVRERDPSTLTADDVKAVLPRFTGRIEQIPPMHSALHYRGRRLYEIAREGRTVERPARLVEVYSLDLVEFAPGVGATAVLDVECSKGTYVRTLCADIGRELGCGAHMSSLVRTRIGRFGIEEAVSLEVIEEKAAEGRIEEVLDSIDEALADMPAVRVSDADALLLSNGVALSADRILDDGGKLPVDVPLRVVAAEGRMIAIGRLSRRDDEEMVLKPEKVWG
jgi:tRNA pseudouridine55 synthase